MCDSVIVIVRANCTREMRRCGMGWGMGWDGMGWGAWRFRIVFCPEGAAERVGLPRERWRPREGGGTAAAAGITSGSALLRAAAAGLGWPGGGGTRMNPSSSGALLAAAPAEGLLVVLLLRGAD